MIYLITFILFLIPVVRFDLMKLPGKRTVWVFLELMFLICIAGFRYRVGGDTLIYMSLFEDYPTIAELPYFDFEEAFYNPLWYIYNSIFKSCGDSFVLFQFVHAIIINVSFFIFFHRYCPNCFFSAVLVYFFGYYVYFNFEILREIMCICILLFAYPYLEQKRFIPYFLLSTIALFFHSFSAIMFLLPLMLLVKRDRLWMAIIIIASIVLLLKVIDVVSILLYMTLEGTAANTIRRYMQELAPNAMGMIVQFLIIVPFLLMMYVRNKFNYRNNDLMGAFLLVTVAIQCAAMFIPLAFRLSNYFMPFGIVYLLNTFYENYWDIRSHGIAKVLVFCSFFVYTFNLSYYYLKNKEDYIPGGHMYDYFIPYNSILYPLEDKEREILFQNERNDDIIK